MRKLMAILAVLGLAFTSLLGATANASENTEAVTIAPASIYDWHRMTTDVAPNVHLICVANGANELPIAAAAQSWNNASSGVGLDYSSNCVLDGYGPGVRMTIDTFHDPNWGTCYKMTNITNDYVWNGWRINYNNPVGWVNTAYNCTSTAVQRAHWTSFVIGRALGLKRLDGSQWAGRVMCYCAQFGYPSASTDGDALTKGYDGTFVGGY